MKNDIWLYVYVHDGISYRLNKNSDPIMPMPLVLQIDPSVITTLIQFANLHHPPVSTADSSNSVDNEYG